MWQISQVGWISKSKKTNIYDICLILLEDACPNLKCQMANLEITKFVVTKFELELVMWHVLAWSVRDLVIAGCTSLLASSWVSFLWNLDKPFSALPKLIILWVFNYSMRHCLTEKTAEQFRFWLNFKIEMRLRINYGTYNTWLR